MAVGIMCKARASMVRPKGKCSLKTSNAKMLMNAENRIPRIRRDQ